MKIAALNLNTEHFTVEHLQDSLANRQLIEGMNGARFDIGGVAFESNYDGSQDEAEKLNDDDESFRKQD